MYTQQSDSERRLHRARFDKYFLTFFSPKSKKPWWTGKEIHVLLSSEDIWDFKGDYKGDLFNSLEIDTEVVGLEYLIIKTKIYMFIC